MRQWGNSIVPNSTYLIESPKYSKDDLWVHDEFSDSPIHAMILAHLDDRLDLPSPIGVFRQYSKETYDEGIRTQINKVIDKKQLKKLHSRMPRTFNCTQILGQLSGKYKKVITQAIHVSRHEVIDVLILH